MKLILSTSNIMTSGPSVIRRPTSEKSNIELINSLKANFTASQQSDGSDAPPSSFTSLNKEGYLSWTRQEGDTLFIPAIGFSQSGLCEERSQYDITVKLFFLPGIPTFKRCAHTQEAIDLVLKELHVKSIDLLIVSLPGISFDADDEGEDEDIASEIGSGSNGNLDDFDSMIRTWRTLETLQEKGTIGQLGVAEFGSERLAKFLPHTKVQPSVDQINVKDCCVVPKSLILFAKQERIELLTHNDCTDILSPGSTRELLGSGENGAGVLATSADGSGGLKGDIEPQWVVKYTAVVKDRGVIENKGYFALAELGNPN